MKVLHSAALLRPPAGIINQMSWEQQAADDLNIDWKVRIFCPLFSTPHKVIVEPSKYVKAEDNKTKFNRIRDWITLRWEYHNWLKSQENDVDVFLLRYYVHDPFQLYFVRTIKKPVFLVHHTLEGPELAMPANIAAKARSILDDLLAPPTIKGTAGIIGVTNEILEYETVRSGQREKSALVYPNGIVFDSSALVDDSRTDVIELLFIASFFSPWHGLDLLLDAMKKNKTSFLLNIVGDLSEFDRNIALSDPRVVLHGRKNQDEIRNIAARCWGGISSFALYRNNMKEACTLKVREYLMMGLPVFSGYKDVFPDSFEYYKMGDVEVNDMINYFSKFKSVDRKTISESSRVYIEKKNLLSDLYERLKCDA